MHCDWHFCVKSIQVSRLTTHILVISVSFSLRFFESVGQGGPARLDILG